MPLPWAAGLTLAFPAFPLSQDMPTFTLQRGDLEDGKGKCPYDPAKGHTGLLVGEWTSSSSKGVWSPSPSGPAHPMYVCLTDGELYSATLNNFLGTEPVILRNMGPRHSMKTEYLASWLNGEP